MRILERGHAVKFGFGRSILSNSLLFPCVNDLTAGFVLVQIRDSIRPVIAVIECGTGDLGSILLQDNFNTGRTFSVLVVIVIPVFDYRERDLFRRMCIRKYSVSYRSGRYGSISGYSRLYPFIGDQGTLIVELRESIQCCRPVIALVQSNRHEVSIVLSENDRQILRTQTILVICVIPDLRDLHRGLFNCNIVRIRDRRICTCRRRCLLIVGLRVAGRHGFLGP